MLSVLLCFAATSVRAADACRAREAGTSFGGWFAPTLTLDAVNWATDVPYPSLGFTPMSARLLLAVDAGTTDRKWNVVVRDERMHVLTTLGPSDFDDGKGALNRRRWTGRLPAHVLKVDLLASTGSDAKVDVVEGLAYPAESSDVHLFSIQGETASWTPLYSSAATIAKRAGDAVGMLLGASEDPGGGERLSWCCSGVMVAKDLFMTNWHCGGAPPMDSKTYWNPDVRNNTLVDLGWDDGTVRRSYNAIDVVAQDQELDYALIRLRPTVGADGGTPEAVAARIEMRPLKDKSPIALVHHAQCKPKLLSDHCHVLSASFPGWQGGAESEFTHDCDSEPGSSGAPVFDAEGRLIGLHHLGFNGGGACASDKMNKAVRIKEIVDSVTRKHPGIASELNFAAD